MADSGYSTITTNSIITLFKDPAKEQRVFPTTKVEAISDENDVTLASLLENRVSKDDASGVNQALSNGYFVLTEGKHYGSALPAPGQKGRIFFRVTGTIPAAEEASF